MINGKVLTEKQSKELISLGLDMSDASFCYSPSGRIQLLNEYNKCDGLWKDIYGNYHKIQFLEKDGMSPYCYEGNYIPTYTLDDIIDKLPQYIEEDEIGRFDYELRIKKDEVSYESYDAFDKEHEQFVLQFFTTGYDNCNTIIDCAFEMLKWCLLNNKCSGN